MFAEMGFGEDFSLPGKPAAAIFLLLCHVYLWGTSLLLETQHCSGTLPNMNSLYLACSSALALKNLVLKTNFFSEKFEMEPLSTLLPECPMNARGLVALGVLLTASAASQCLLLFCVTVTEVVGTGTQN